MSEQAFAFSPQPRAIHQCRWGWCRLAFESPTVLKEHVIHEHVRNVKPVRRGALAMLRRIEYGAGESTFSSEIVSHTSFNLPDASFSARPDYVDARNGSHPHASTPASAPLIVSTQTWPEQIRLRSLSAAISETSDVASITLSPTFDSQIEAAVKGQRSIDRFPSIENGGTSHHFKDDQVREKPSVDQFEPARNRKEPEEANITSHHQVLIRSQITSSEVNLSQSSAREQCLEMELPTSRSEMLPMSPRTGVTPSSATPRSSSCILASASRSRTPNIRGPQRQPSPPRSLQMHPFVSQLQSSTLSIAAGDMAPEVAHKSGRKQCLRKASQSQSKHVISPSHPFSQATFPQSQPPPSFNSIDSGVALVPLHQLLQTQAPCPDT